MNTTHRHIPAAFYRFWDIIAVVLIIIQLKSHILYEFISHQPYLFVEIMRRARRNFIKKAAIGSFLSVLGFDIMGKVGQEKHVLAFDKSGDNLWREVKKAFLLTEKRNYFNTAGLGPSPEVVIDRIYEKLRMAEEWSESYHGELKDIRDKIAQFFNTSAEEIAFTRNTTEGMNMIARSLPLKKGDEVLITTHEHVGGISPWLALQQELGMRIKTVELDLSGARNLSMLKQAVTKRTKAVVLSHITCTTGMVLPVQEIVQFCRERAIYSCIDGAQAAGMIKVDLSTINPDFYAMSGHKWLFGPKETGLLFVNRTILNELKPAYVGAYSVQSFDLKERQITYVDNASFFEYGTRNVPIVHGLDAAIDFINAIGMDKVEERSKQLANYLKSELAKIPQVIILSPINPDYASAIVTFKVNGLDYNAVRDTLMQEYKCRLRAIYENELNAIRVSCAIYNTIAELDELIDAVKQLSVNAED
ncbi:MAG: aminotransferase class V-fold PLP-dependent enzyme [Flammeovirgaceae bacterium]